jgi:hypothetical protein
VPGLSARVPHRRPGSPTSTLRTRRLWTILWSSRRRCSVTAQ